jgi:putative membrane protein
VTRVDGPGGKPSLPTTDRLAYDRTLLANERTLAAWLRTGLAVAAVGYAAIHLLPHADARGGLVRVVGGVMVVAGAAVVVFGGVRFAAIARALGDGGSPGAALRPALVNVVTGAVALLVLSLLLLL